MFRLARVGDKDSRGNTIIEGSPNMKDQGLPVARVGDKLSDGSVITTGNPTILVDGKPAAIVGSQVSNGNVIVSPCSSKVTTGFQVGAGAGSAIQSKQLQSAGFAPDTTPETLTQSFTEAAKPEEQKEEEQAKNWVRLELVTEDGSPVPNANYELYDQDTEAQIQKGQLDAKGKAFIELREDIEQVRVLYPDHPDPEEPELAPYKKQGGESNDAYARRLAKEHKAAWVAEDRAKMLTVVKALKRHLGISEPFHNGSLSTQDRKYLALLQNMRTDIDIWTSQYLTKTDKKAEFFPLNPLIKLGPDKYLYEINSSGSIFPLKDVAMTRENGMDEENILYWTLKHIEPVTEQLILQNKIKSDPIRFLQENPDLVLEGIILAQSVRAWRRLNREGLPKGTVFYMNPLGGEGKSKTTVKSITTKKRSLPEQNKNRVASPANKPEKHKSLHRYEDVPETYRKDPRFNDLASDPDHSGAIKPTTRAEAMAGLEAEKQGLIKGPIKRGPRGIEFYDGDGNPWDVKAPPSAKPGKPDFFDPEQSGKSIQSELRKKGIPHGTYPHESSGKPAPRRVILDSTYMNEKDHKSLWQWLDKNLTKEELNRIVEVNTKL
ncbi:PAAR domain-containing protein [Zooshikella ganghwensis]|uniref:PAAR domain-containing protein n=1 Tax=Zooshikella ganghwensis TaxID=202772 RepID=UPI000402650F|nr:PAAR domain-containing protein [Zooshikella ganghwensis]